MTEFLNMSENNIGFRIKGITRKTISMVILLSKQPTENGSATRNFSMSPKDSLVSKDVKVVLERLCKKKADTIKRILLIDKRGNN